MHRLATQPLPDPQRLSLQRPAFPLRFLLVSLLFLVAQLVFPLQRAEGAPVPMLVPLDEASLTSITGGCYSCGGGGGGGGGSAGVRGPEPIGSPYWEYSHRVLLARPAVPADLVWHLKNTTPYQIGPMSIEYEKRESLSWDVEANVPAIFVRAQVGAEFSRRVTTSIQFSVPAMSQAKLFVKYPYERYRHYYVQYQDLDDNTRDIVSNGTAVVEDHWTLANVVHSSLQ